MKYLTIKMGDTSEKLPIDRSGVSAERRKLQKIDECGFLPKAATPVLQRSLRLMIIVGFCLGLAGASCKTTAAESPSFQVQLPAKGRPFPEPLAAGQQPGFKFRGTKGWAWTPEQYLEEIPWLPKFQMKF